MPLDQAPLEFWRLAFPFPFRAAIEHYSHEQGLDPFLVAAAHSARIGVQYSLHFPRQCLRSHAGVAGYGSRPCSPLWHGRFSASEWLTSDRNIQLGTYFFKTLLDNNGGEPEIALAAYNAGPSRSALWRTWGPFQSLPNSPKSCRFMKRADISKSSCATLKFIGDSTPAQRRIFLPMCRNPRRKWLLPNIALRPRPKSITARKNATKLSRV